MCPQRGVNGFEAQILRLVDLARVQGLVSPGGPENPIWTLVCHCHNMTADWGRATLVDDRIQAQKYNLTNTYVSSRAVDTDSIPSASKSFGSRIL